MKKLKCIAVLFVFILSFSAFASCSFADDAQPQYETGVYDGKYYEDGEFKEDATGTAIRMDDGAEVYVENGLFKEDASGIAARISDGTLLYVENGVFKKVTGAAPQISGSKSFYVLNGVFKDTTDVVKRLSDGKQVYVKNGVFTKSTDVVKRLSDGKQVYVKNGEFTKSTGVVKRLSDNKWLYVKKGVFTKSTGIAKRLTDNKQVYVKKGVFTKSTGIAKNLSSGKWLYVKKGVFKTATGVAKQIGKSQWNYVKKGVFSKYTGLAKRLTDSRWVYVIGGAPTTDVSKFRLSAEDERAGRLRPYVEAYAHAVADNITNKKMSESEKIRACFNYVITYFNSTDNPRIPHFTGKNWQYIYAYDMFGPRGGGNCMSFGAAFAFIAKAAGCREVYAINNGAHGWTEINGLVYDPEQYHDTNDRKIYAWSYSDSRLGGYWASVSGPDSAVFRKLIKAF